MQNINTHQWVKRTNGQIQTDSSDSYVRLNGRTGVCVPVRDTPLVVRLERPAIRPKH